MIFPQLQPLAELAVERTVNSLPAGLTIPLFAWTVLRILPKQNSRSRFAVWTLALLTVVALPCLGGFALTEANGKFVGVSIPASAISAISLPAHWAAYLFIAWLVAASAALTRLAAGVFRLRQLRHSCMPVDVASLDPSLIETINELTAARSFASRSVSLATSERMRVPAALGLWKPMIVLPMWTLRELAPQDLSIILRHEFAHLRRWDDWTNLLQKMIRALLFFHPAVWWIENRLSVEREMACDDVVVAQTDNPIGYASCLVSLLEGSLAQRGWTMAQAIVHRAREASLRLTRILDKNRPAPTGISKPALGLVGTFAVLCLAMLPHTPELVAFDRGPLPAPADAVYSGALARPAALHIARVQGAFGSPAVIPAALKINASKTGQLPSPPKNFKSAIPHAVVARRAANREPAAELNPAPAFESLLEASVLPDRDLPAMQMLVFVEATQFMTMQFADSDSTISGSTISGSRIPGSAPVPATLWRVQVWRVTVFTPALERRARVPVANKT
jgi:beta-lactamase regulating signal transducer with metallopeptidase domain